MCYRHMSKKVACFLEKKEAGGRHCGEAVYRGGEDHDYAELRDDQSDKERLIRQCSARIKSCILTICMLPVRIGDLQE